MMLTEAPAAREGAAGRDRGAAPGGGEADIILYDTILYYIIY